MKLRNTVVAGLMLTASAGALPASAQPAPTLDCATAEAAATEACLRARYSAVDVKLNESYKAALAFVDTRGLNRNLTMDWKRALQEAQRKWIAYREADCGPPVSYEHGGKGVAQQITCKIARTEERQAALAARYSRPAQ